MALTSADDYLASVHNYVGWLKTATRTTVAASPFSLFDIAGNPGAGTLNAGNTANGVVRTDATTGMPTIPAISGTGYLTRVEFGWTVAGRLLVYDQVFSCGAYAYNANTTLASQPSYAGRMPGGVYDNTELWVEAVTAFTGTPSVQVNYLDQGGAAGDTGVVSCGAALIIGRMFRLPLASGDTGVQQITQVRGTVASAGTFNVHVMRRLWSGRSLAANYGDIHDLFKTGSPQVYDNSALMVVVQPDSTSSALPEVYMEITDS